jgi:hypothetical protein
MTTNALAAADGFKAERMFSSQENIKRVLEGYFGKSIKSIEVIPGRKKTDARIHFTEGSCNIQIKNYKTANIEKGNAHQLNRRPLGKCPPLWQGYLGHICLGRSKNRGRCKGLVKKEFYSPFITPSAEDSKELIRMASLGSENEYKPDYIVLTYMTNSVIENIWIESMEHFLATCDSAVYETPQESSSGTSVFLCPEVSVQGKGGDKGAESANDIQFKFNLSAEIMGRHKFQKIL